MTIPIFIALNTWTDGVGGTAWNKSAVVTSEEHVGKYAEEAAKEAQKEVENAVASAKFLSESSFNSFGAATKAELTSGYATKTELAGVKVSPAHVITATTYTLEASDLDKTIEYNETTTIGKIKLPETLPLGAVVIFCQVNTAQLELVVTSPTKLFIPVGLKPKTREQWSTLSARYRAAGEWVASGDFAEV